MTHVIIAVLQLAFVILFAGCGREGGRPASQTVSKDTELSHQVGRQITLKGTWMPDGKFGPYILLGREQVYVRAGAQDSLHQLNSLGSDLAGWKNKPVQVSGTLHRQKELRSTNTFVSSIPAYYFVELPDASISKLPN